MASSSSINTFSFNSQPDLHNPKPLKHTTMFNRPYNPRHTPKPLSLFSNLQPISRLHMSLKTHHHLPNFYSQLPILPKPTSILSPLKIFSTFYTEKIAVLLVGSFVFLGCLCTRPVVALPAQQQSSNSENVEEERETQNGKSDDEEMYAKLLEENPRNVEALKVVLYENMRKGKTKEAVEYVERLIEAQPGEVEWRLLQALCYEMMGQFSKAKRLFKEILAKRPLLLRALHGELEEGLKIFQILVDENPRDFRPYLCQGIIYSLLDKKKEADEQFQIYRSLVPEEFPQRGFLDDVVLAAKTGSQQQFEKEFKAEFSYKN
ncbi:protein SLOW GREEN 1, chloroplastic isoform X2 [Camellia sinensis]|uniref:protein SLOW GREEN 1, chloroplastic isoform X2 n=1 Tax=Camellia sinensis TaxID=4442 RepID=UPI001036E5F8|nr:protein SLOW GREEN 1, chloroplastic isoform X2 [Camellia sinensis]